MSIFSRQRETIDYSISFLLKGRMVLECFSQICSKMKSKKWYSLLLVLALFGRFGNGRGVINSYNITIGDAGFR